MATTAFGDVAACMGDRTRAVMLDALMDGRAHTATELAVESGVSASTASSHLARLVDARLVEVVREGRHRYFRLASAEVAAALEQLMGLGGRTVPPRGPSDPRLRRARICYDHLAGELAVEVFRRMRADRLIEGRDFEFALTAQGRAWCADVGLPARTTTTRPFCRACLDWSERRPHLAGGLGASLLDRLIGLGHARKALDSRAVTLTAAGERFLETLRLS